MGELTVKRVFEPGDDSEDHLRRVVAMLLADEPSEGLEPTEPGAPTG
jgi:hypothetical protein